MSFDVLSDEAWAAAVGHRPAIWHVGSSQHLELLNFNTSSTVERNGTIKGSPAVVFLQKLHQMLQHSTLSCTDCEIAVPANARATTFFGVQRDPFESCEQAAELHLSK